MPVRLLVILLLVVFEGAFIGFNLENTCNVWLFRVFPSVPVYLTVLVSFVAGVLLTVPFFAFRKKKTPRVPPVREKKSRFPVHAPEEKQTAGNPLSPAAGGTAAGTEK